MTSDWLGGGLIVGLAAVLWLIYLLPTWFRRNEYIATERNVVRLQQTLRILAETSEIPDEVRAEASAKSVAEHQRLLKKATVHSIPPAIRVAARIRRARAVTTAILALALIVTVLGAVQAAVNGAWLILIVGVVASTLCVTRLGRLAKEGRANRGPAALAGAAAARAAVALADRSSSDAADEVALEQLADSREFGIDIFDDDKEASADSAGSGDALGDDSAWTPVPLPKPLYTERRRLRQLSVGQPVSGFGSSTWVGLAEQTAVHAESALRLAAAQSEQALRAGFAAAAVAPGSEAPAVVERVGGVPTPAAAPVSPSRFSTMGIVDGLDTGSLDVDQVLARRRAG